MIPTVLICVGVVNLVTFVMFGVDKRRARLGAWRIPEATLIGLSFATGFVGGWLAMRTFRHKTRKTSFRVKMVLVTVFNLAWLLVWLGYEGHLS